MGASRPGVSTADRGLRERGGLTIEEGLHIVDLEVSATPNLDGWGKQAECYPVRDGSQTSIQFTRQPGSSDVPDRGFWFRGRSSRKHR